MVANNDRKEAPQHYDARLQLADKFHHTGRNRWQTARTGDLR